MSIELPEALILAKQMKEVLIGKQVESYHLQKYERMKKVGFLNKNVKDFDQLLNGKITSVIARGNVIRVEFDNNMNLLIAPEYGGEILYHEDGTKRSKEYHLKIQFSDDTSLTVRIKSMGCILALKDEELVNSYMYKRDFLRAISPIEDEFTFERFSKEINILNRNLKGILVGKDAMLVGISNSAFQDIIYRAKLFPKKKGSELNMDETKALFDAINSLINERQELGGKNLFMDMYAKKGKYIPVMGPNMKGKNCSECGTGIEKMSFGGGQIYLCPRCQEH
ncbi:MAG: DNA-formamidopyrimidine glycosylase family protein [Candidatus Hodarchaeales archaeon]|jgi:formamidopyrimidine-DNA glycosylase